MIATYVVVSSKGGWRDGPVAGFPFIRDADRLGRLLLHALRLVQKRKLVKFLNVCKKRRKKNINISIKLAKEKELLSFFRIKPRP